MHQVCLPVYAYRVYSSRLTVAKPKALLKQFVRNAEGQAVHEYKEAAGVAEIVGRAVDVASRRAVHALKEEGLSLGDNGPLMGTSHQRAAQLSG